MNSRLPPKKSTIDNASLPVFTSANAADAPPPRLSVIFAAEAHEAVVFARGPSKWFHVIRWNTRHDKFEPGAWIRGRIYPERSDLSPDGRLLLYFVLQGRPPGSTYTSTWTGISRTPWLTALALWPEGSTWGGGGHFAGPRHVVLTTCGSGAAHPDHLPTGLQVSFGSKVAATPLPVLEGSEWSGRDQRGRLIVATQGRLVWHRDNGEQTVLADFNDDTPNPQPAPDWARRPLICKRGKWDA